MNKKLVIIILGVFIVGGLLLMSLGNYSVMNFNSKSSVTLAGDPLDTVNGFFNDWLNARTSTSSDPYALNLPSDTRLATSTKEYIQTADRTSTKDPVLCLTQLPPRIGAKPVFKLADTAQYVVVARGVGGVTPDRAVVDLSIVDDVWLITKIECISGESAPEREFAFERTGYLLKHNEPPLDPNTWYVVFAENGEDGHIAPLHFSDQSICVDAGAAESVCDPNSFTNAIQATVKGGMSEAGVDVKRIEFTN